MSNKSITTKSGSCMPRIGLGTWRITGSDTVYNALKSALMLGYRHIDTAYIYDNEKDIGDALQRIYKETGLKREDLFITSKLWNTHHKNPDVGLKRTLSDLQTDYLDLYLIHWPVTFEVDTDFVAKRKDDGSPVLSEFDVQSIYQTMETFVDQGLVNYIGVANFGLKNLKKVLDFCRIKPITNQIELHPYLKQTEIVDFCSKNEIFITAYSSLGSLYDPETPSLLNDEVIKAVALERKITPAQVILSYLLAKNIVVIPKTVSPSRLAENLKADPKHLTPSDILKIDQIQTEWRYVNIPSFGPNHFD